MRHRDYINSDRGRLNRHLWRHIRQIRFSVNGIEPASKQGMPLGDKVAFQRRVEQSLASLRKRAFRGPMVLALNLQTSGPTPSHIHTITKNLQDLMAAPLPETRSRRKALVFQDDRDVWGLTVQCDHGHENPLIQGNAASLRDFIADLDLAEQIRRESSTDCHEEWDWDEDPIDELRRILRNEADERRMWGDAYSSIVEVTRRMAQEKVLGHSTLRVQELHTLYDAAGLIEGTSNLENGIIQRVARAYTRAGVRVRLDELPQEAADGRSYRQAVRKAIEDFKSRYGWILQPLLMPIAVEVLIKPPPLERSKRPRDLDNVVRKYILPGIIEILNPPSAFAWTIDVDRVRGQMPDLASRWDSRLSKLPKSTKVGVTRFDAWRVPRHPNDMSPGFVIIGLAADGAGIDGVWRRIKTAIDEWGNSLEGYR